MQICIGLQGENAILMHFHAIIPDIRLSGEQENILTTNFFLKNDFPAAWDYGKMSLKFLGSRVKVIDEIFVLFFKFG